MFVANNYFHKLYAQNRSVLKEKKQKSKMFSKWNARKAPSELPFNFQSNLRISFEQLLIKQKGG